MYIRGVNRAGPYAGLTGFGLNLLSRPARADSGLAERFLNLLAIRAGSFIF